MSDLILPPLRRSLADTVRFANIVHAGQTDKAGKPYVLHLARVSDRVNEFSADCPFWDENELLNALQIAWLHDTIEDCGFDADRLLDEGFHRVVVASVRLVTKPSRNQRYHDWIEHVGMVGSLAAILVKLADVEDNSDPERLAALDDATRERLTKKYAGAADLLREAARRKGWQG